MHAMNKQDYAVNDPSRQLANPGDVPVAVSMLQPNCPAYHEQTYGYSQPNDPLGYNPTSLAAPPPYRYPAAHQQQFQPAPQLQQQQQQTVHVIQANTTEPVARDQIPSVIHYDCHQAFACFVLWCCNWPFGLIAWILANSAESYKFDNPRRARHLGISSIVLSVSGIICSIVLVSVIVALGNRG